MGGSAVRSLTVKNEVQTMGDFRQVAGQVLWCLIAIGPFSPTPVWAVGNTRRAEPIDVGSRRELFVDG